MVFRQNVLLSLSGPSLQYLMLFETLVNKFSRLHVAIISFLVANMHIVCRILSWLFPPISQLLYFVLSGAKKQYIFWLLFSPADGSLLLLAGSAHSK